MGVPGWVEGFSLRCGWRIDRWVGVSIDWAVRQRLARAYLAGEEEEHPEGEEEEERARQVGVVHDVVVQGLCVRIVYVVWCVRT